MTSPRIAKLGWQEEVFYRRLLSVVDDFGRYYADPGMLRAACYPRLLAKVSDSDIGKWLAVCAEAALVRVYPAKDGERYLEVLDFGQQVRAKKSKYPDALGTCVADAQQMPANDHLDVSVSVDVSEVVPTVLVAAERLPACPAEEIVALYHEHLPSLPEVMVLSDTRKRTIAARWREVCAAEKFDRTQGLEWFAWFFGHASKSRFLTGRSGDWRADFDFLMTSSKFAKVIEGSYHKDAA